MNVRALFSAPARIAVITSITMFLTTCAGSAENATDAAAQSRGMSRFETRFGITARYETDYADAHKDAVSVRVPEVFELANIAVAVTDYGREHPYRVFKEGAYYEEVMAHFGPYSDHPLVEKIEFSDERIGDYYEWRTASLGYRFEGSELVAGSPYRPTKEATGWFHDQLELIEDFAETSGFRTFYAEHAEFYDSQIASYEEKVPVRRMWDWLDAQFPAADGAYDAYTIVFSPLIYASHNTIRFDKDGFSECIMVVGGPDLLAGRTNDKRLEQALLSRLLFTEIDHNYVNPLSRQYEVRIARALSDLDTWNGQDGYRSPQATFNEYVTWAAFLLYAQEHYDDEVVEAAGDYTVQSMEKGRKFLRFGDFVNWLSAHWASRDPDETVADLYPEMIGWFDAR